MAANKTRWNIVLMMAIYFAEQWQLSGKNAAKEESIITTEPSYQSLKIALPKKRYHTIGHEISFK